jgi:FAD:protein FMN transferase
MKSVSNRLRRARPLLGTFVEITAIGFVDEGSAARAIDAAFDAVALAHRLMSFHEGGSDVSRLNREGARRGVDVHPWTYRVLAAATALQRSSLGRFDIAVAPAMQALQLLPTTDDTSPPVHDPCSLGDSSVILLPNHRVRLRHPKTRIDVGGIAKGFAVDQAVTVLRAHGLAGGLVNAGGDMAAFGAQPQRVDIRHPLDPKRSLSRVDLEEEALASSGPRFGTDGSSPHAGAAIVDPTTGRAVTEVVGATARAHTCMMADALTKPAMILAQSSLPLLDRHGASALLVLRNGETYATSNWKEAADRAA